MLTILSLLVGAVLALQVAVLVGIGPLQVLLFRQGLPLP
jgi:hypothetical protein